MSKGLKRSTSAEIRADLAKPRPRPRVATGSYGIPGHYPGKIHMVVDGKPVCGTHIHRDAEFQWNAYGVVLEYIDCARCRAKAQEYARLVWLAGASYGHLFTHQYEAGMPVWWAHGGDVPATVVRVGLDTLTIAVETPGGGTQKKVASYRSLRPRVEVPYR